MGPTKFKLEGFGTTTVPETIDQQEELKEQYISVHKTLKPGHLHKTLEI